MSRSNRGRKKSQNAGADEDRKSPASHTVEGEHQGRADRASDEEATQERRVVHYQEISGPIPHPTLLSGYEDIVPGAADRIIQMAEKESEHRRTQESHVVSSDIKSRTIGQWMAFVLVGGAIVAGSYVATHGAPWAGGLIGVAGLGGVFGSRVIRDLFNRGNSSEGQKIDKDPNP